MSMCYDFIEIEITRGRTHQIYILAREAPQIKIKVGREERYHQAQDYGDSREELGPSARGNAEK